MSFFFFLEKLHWKSFRHINLSIRAVFRCIFRMVQAVIKDTLLMVISNDYDFYADRQLLLTFFSHQSEFKKNLKLQKIIIFESEWINKLKIWWFNNGNIICWYTDDDVNAALNHISGPFGPHVSACQSNCQRLFWSGRHIIQDLMKKKNSMIQCGIEQSFKNHLSSSNCPHKNGF